MTKIKTGDLLIAPPNCLDHRFKNSVMLITRHSDHSMALCLNRPGEINLSRVLDRCDLFYDQDLYWGGPMFLQTIWMLHDPNWIMVNTVEIDDKWNLTSNADMIDRMVKGDIPDRFRLFYGCATWAPGQLMMEINGEYPWSPEHSWLIAESPDPDWLISTNPDDLWSKSIELSSNQAVSAWF
jgi:putative transcriptional regulator